MKSSHDTKRGNKKSKSSSASTADTTTSTSTTADKLSKYGDYSSNNASGSGSSSGAVRAPVTARAPTSNDNDNSDNEEEGGGGVNQAADFDRMMRAELIKKRQVELAAESAKMHNSNTTFSNTTNNNNSNSGGNGDDGVIMDHSSMQDAINDGKRSGQLKDKTDTFKKLREDLLRSRRAVSVLMGTDADKHQQESAFTEMVSPLEQRRLKYMKRKSEHGDRSEETMEKLKKFTSAIRTTKQQHSGSDEHGSAADGSEDNYRGQVLEQDERQVDPESEKRDLQTWFVGKLKCKKHIDDNYRNNTSGTGTTKSGASGSDGRYMDDYMVIDPRNQHQPSQGQGHRHGRD